MYENNWKMHFLDDGEIVITLKIIAAEVTFKESPNYLEWEVKNWPNWKMPVID